MSKPVVASLPTVLVTGASGGLGREIVQAFRNLGHPVVGTGRQGALPEASPDWQPVRVDLLEPDAMARLKAAIPPDWDAPRIVVHNAGEAVNELVARLSVEDWDRMMQLHVRVARDLYQTFLGESFAGGDGCLLLLGSHAARLGGAGQAGYAASKAALMGLAVSLAREGASRGVRVNTVWPGVLDTAMTRALKPEARQRLLRQNLITEPGDPAEVASFIAHLAGMRHVSGQCFALDSRILPWA